MTEQTKHLVESTKHQMWKWLGSMFMEPKTGADGETHMAASLTKVLTLVLFIGVFIYWYASPETVPESMVQTLWAMLGVKSVHMVAGAIRAAKA